MFPRRGGRWRTRRPPYVRGNRHRVWVFRPPTPTFLFLRRWLRRRPRTGYGRFRSARVPERPQLILNPLATLPFFKIFGQTFALRFIDLRCWLWLWFGFCGLLLLLLLLVFRLRINGRRRSRCSLALVGCRGELVRLCVEDRVLFQAVVHEPR